LAAGKRRASILAGIGQFLRQRSWILALGQYVLGFGLLGWLIWKNWQPAPGSKGIGLSQIVQQTPRLGPFIACAAVYMVAVLLTFYRWYVLVRAQDLPISLYNAMRLGLVGFFFSTFLPSAIGGDFVKAAFIAREQERRTVAVSTILIDRAIGLWGLLWVIVLLSAIFWALGNPVLQANDYLKSIVFASSVIVGASLAGWIIVQTIRPATAEKIADWLNRFPKIGHSVAEAWRAVWMYRQKQLIFLGALGISIVSHVGFVLAFYFASQVYANQNQPDSIPSLVQDFILVPVGTGAQALIPLPGGVGVGETFYGYGYEMLGKSFDEGVAASFAQRIVIWGWSFLGYLVYLQMKPALRPKPNPELAAAACE
jgi:glycosyltransferase 2 family protein